LIGSIKNYSLDVFRKKYTLDVAFYLSSVLNKKLYRNKRHNIEIFKKQKKGILKANVNLESATVDAQFFIQ